MKKLMWKRGVAAVAAAAALMIAVPTAAMAVSYADDVSSPTASSSVIAPGGTLAVAFAGFAPNERVTFRLTGESAGGASVATLAANASTAPTAKNADANGSVSVSITLPATATCDHVLEYGTSNWVKQMPIKVEGSDQNCLAVTGVEDSALLFGWVGAGAIALIGGGLLVASSVRKQRKLAA